MESLFVVSGSRPCCWQLPLYGIARGDEVELWAAVPLLKIQRQVLNELLCLHGRPFNGMWRLSPYELGRVAETRADGTDPEELVVWGRRRSPPRPSKTEQDAFVDQLHLSGIGSHAECTLWWNTICNAALDWLINKERPLDMGFIRLHNSPYRISWQDRISRRWSEHGRPRDMHRDLLNSSLFLTGDYGELVRHIDVEHTPTWWTTIKQVEVTRLALLKDDYAGQILASIRGRLSTTIRILEAWALHHLAPSAAIGIDRPQCRPSFERAGRNGRFDSERARTLSRAALAMRWKVWSGRRPRTKKVRRVRLLRAIQQFKSYLRDGRRHVDRPRNSLEQAVRVLVLSSGGDSHPQELLAGPGDPGREGMAGDVQLPP